MRRGMVYTHCHLQGGVFQRIPRPDSHCRIERTMTDEGTKAQSPKASADGRRIAAAIVPAILKTFAVAAACAGLWLYLDYRSPRAVARATELRDGSEHRVVKSSATRIGESFTLFQTNAPVSSVVAAWPCFRGERRDAVRTALADFSDADRAELARLLARFAEAWPRS